MKRAGVALALFVAGAGVGSLAPFFSMVGSNPMLLKLVLQTWQTYLFAYGWWPWCLVLGVAAAGSYLLVTKRTAKM